MSKRASKSTINYYDDNTVEFACQTLSIDMHDLYELFINQLPQRDTQCILDVGCGSGRDASYFAKQGYEVTAIDVIAATSGLPVQEVMTELIMLELNGLILSVPGGYVRTRSA